MNKLITALIVTIVLFLVSFGIGFWFNTTLISKPKIESQAILVAMQNEGFFVTQEMAIDQTVLVNNTSGNSIKDFFLREKVEASATLRVALGIDTNQLNQEDIQVKRDEIIISVPTPTIFSTEIIGDVQIDSDNGIITKITKGKEDFNTLSSLLKEQARGAALSAEYEEALLHGTIESITTFMNALAPQYTVTVEFT